MDTDKLKRGIDLFWVTDLVYRAAVKIGVDPMKPRLKPADYTVDKTGVTFASGAVVQWNDLGLGNLQRVKDLIPEYISRLPEFVRSGVSPDLPFIFSADKTKWYFTESGKEHLFREWGNQLATGANSFVL